MSPDDEGVEAVELAILGRGLERFEKGDLQIRVDRSPAPRISLLTNVMQSRYIFSFTK